MKDSSAVPLLVKNEMAKLIGNEVVKVPIRKRGRTSEGRSRWCHPTVAEWVKKIGGKQITGWMLDHYPKFDKHGVYTWIFHSVWETPEGKWVHVNKEDDHEHIRNIMFCPDDTREFDPVKGLNINNLTFFTNTRAIRWYNRRFGRCTEAANRPGFYWGHGFNPLVPFSETDGVLKSFYDFDDNLIKKHCSLAKKVYGIDIKKVDGCMKWEIDKTILKTYTYEKYKELCHTLFLAAWDDLRMPFLKEISDKGELPTPRYYR